MKRVAFIILTLIGLACQEDYFPPGLYGYQAERLLTGGDEKTWFADQMIVDGQVVPVETCQDSAWLYMARVGSATNDSLVAYEIRPGLNCGLYDSIYFGTFYASGQTGPFRDSLIFSGGAINYAMVEHIDSDDLILRYDFSGSSIEAHYSSSMIGLTPRQVEHFLAGGADSEKTFALRQLRIDSEMQQLASCEDSVQVLFRNENDVIKAYEVTPLPDCEDSRTTFYGNVQMSTDDGFFSDTLFFSGGELDTVLSDFIDSNSFAWQYQRDTLQYDMSFRLTE